MAAHLVNPLGATTSVNDEDAERLVAEGFRVATDAEVTAWYAAQGISPDGSPVKPAKAPKAE